MNISGLTIHAMGKNDKAIAQNYTVGWIENLESVLRTFMDMFVQKDVCSYTSQVYLMLVKKSF